MNNLNKICATCKIEKPLELFGAMKTNTDGHRNICKNCRKNYYYKNHKKLLEEKKEHYAQNKEMYQKSFKKYYEKNKKEIINKVNKHYHQNKNDPNFYYNREREKINQKKKERRQKQSIIREQQKIQEMFDSKIFILLEKQCTECKITKTMWEFNKQINSLLNRKAICRNCQSGYRKQYQIDNKEILAEKQKIYNQKLHRKIANRIRSAMRRAVKDYRANKKETTFEYLGCSISYLVEHLEKQFTPDMNWDEFKKGDIHIDHISPLCEYDLTKEENLYKVCNYTNLRPLWWEDNLTKTTQDKKLSIHKKIS